MEARTGRGKEDGRGKRKGAEARRQTLARIARLPAQGRRRPDGVCFLKLPRPARLRLVFPERLDHFLVVAPADPLHGGGLWEERAAVDAGTGDALSGRTAGAEWRWVVERWLEGGERQEKRSSRSEECCGERFVCLCKKERTTGFEGPFQVGRLLHAEVVRAVRGGPGNPLRGHGGG